MRPNVLLFLALGLSVAASYAAYITAPAVTGDIYRILYMHVPSAWVCYLSFSISLIASILFLAQRKEIFDMIAEISTILGLVYGAVALITGSIWANAVWGSVLELGPKGNDNPYPVDCLHGVYFHETLYCGCRAEKSHRCCL